MDLGLFGLCVRWNLCESESHLEWVMGSGFTCLNPPSLAGGGGDQPPTLPPLRHHYVVSQQNVGGTPLDGGEGAGLYARGI